MRRTNVLAVLVCLFLANSTFAQKKSETAKLKSSEVFANAEKIADAARDEIWTGFDVRRYATLKSDSGSHYINFTSEPDNRDAPFFWQLSDEYFSNYSLEENLSIMFHEAFHGFERDAKRPGGKWRAENSLLVFEYAETSARNNALFNIEGRILAAALETEKMSRLKQKARQFLAVRKLRQSEFDARFADFEKGAESNEGLAEYAGTRAVVWGIEAVKAKKISVPFAATDSRAFLRKKYEKLNSITDIGRNIRLKFYYTGSAQGFLLDRLLTDWKARVQTGGAAVQDLLAEAVAEKKSKRQPEVEAILREYDYENILRAEQNAVAQRAAANQLLLDTTLNQGGLKFVIDFSSLAQAAQIRSFDPMNVTKVLPRVRVHTRMVEFAGQNDSFVARFTQPVVEDLENKHYTTIVPENASVKITVDDVVIDANKPTAMPFDKSLVITSPNFNFRAAAGTVTVSNKQLVIRPADQK